MLKKGGILILKIFRQSNDRLSIPEKNSNFILPNRSELRGPEGLGGARRGPGEVGGDRRE